MARSHVYFLRTVGHPNKVKIGSSIWPWGRLKTMAMWSPVPLELVAMTPGDAQLEQRFHAHFRHLHSHGEWFDNGPDLDAAIASIAAGAFDVEQLAAASRLTVECRWSDEAREDVSNAQRVRWLEKWGHPIPEAVRAALCGRYQPDPTELASKRQIVRAFVDEHYEPVKALRSATARQKKAA